jgi:hypothetical protein
MDLVSIVVVAQILISALCAFTHGGKSIHITNGRFWCLMEAVDILSINLMLQILAQMDKPIANV